MDDLWNGQWEVSEEKIKLLPVQVFFAMSAVEPALPDMEKSRKSLAALSIVALSFQHPQHKRQNLIGIGVP